MSAFGDCLKLTNIFMLKEVGHLHVISNTKFVYIAVTIKVFSALFPICILIVFIFLH